MTDAATARPITIPCPDGPILPGRLFLPPVGEPEMALLVNGATGVPRDYYARFARWAATERRAAVLIYDYRDCGEAARGPVRQSTASMGDWGVQDQGAALEWLCGTYPDLPVEVVGHSLGGMFLNFHDKANRVRRLTAVASGPAHWRRHPAGFTPQVLMFWFLAGPLVTRAMGYMPGKMLGLGADLPPEVYWQWRRWCTSRRFFKVDWGRHLPEPDLTRMTGEVRLVGIADDPMIPPPVVRDLAEFYPRARVEHRVITPAEVGVKAIGHLRVFSDRCRAAWPLLLA
ncbi:MAG: hypothetical protein RLY86_3730 [Pseudomonadota bacterium]|jgi:predicted alpha/beta hydrolase